MPEVFVPYTVTGAFERGILVRTSKDPLPMLNTVRREIWAVDRNVALTLTGSLKDYLNRFSYSEPRFSLILLGVFAGVGLVLVAIGVYSVIAYTVSRQTHEIGIRMALGAGRADVMRMVLRMGLRLIGLGMVGRSGGQFRRDAPDWRASSGAFRRTIRSRFAAWWRLWPVRDWRPAIFRRAARRAWIPWSRCDTSSQRSLLPFAFASGRYPPAMAPTTRNGSAPVATASGSGASGGSWDRSSSQAKNRTNGRRCCVTWSRIVPRSIG